MKRKKYISFSVRPSGIAAGFLAFLFLPSEQVFSAIAALLWHETAHLAAFLACGVRKCRIELTPFGGMADVQAYEKMPPVKQALCALAGIAGSWIGAILVWSMLKKNRFGWPLFQAHLSLGVFNCLPGWPLDGARMLVSAAACFGKENGMRRILAGISVVLGMGMVWAALWGALQGWINPSLLFAGPYLCYTSRMGLASERIRSLGQCSTKLKTSFAMPAEIYACVGNDVENRFAAMLGQCPQSRYRFLFQLNESGQIKRVWTEEEMFRSVLNQEAIGIPNQVDKRHEL